LNANKLKSWHRKDRRKTHKTDTVMNAMQKNWR